MPAGQKTDPGLQVGGDAASQRHHRDLMRRTLLHLMSIYLLPFLLLTVYFHFQSLRVIETASRHQLQSVAEYQAHMLDLFIRERAVNLANLIDNPSLEVYPSRQNLEYYLQKLKRDSGTFVDLGVFDSTGVQVAYAGPFPVLEKRNYGSEPWFVNLRRSVKDFVITDSYLGFRQRPHFTIAVSRRIGGRYLAMRATLDPDRIYDYITSLEGAREVHTSIVNQDGAYQVVTPGEGTSLADSAIVPQRAPRIGVARVKLGGRSLVYGYSWLVEADWALITQGAGPGPKRYLLGGDYRLAAVTLLIVLCIAAATIIRTRKRVRIEEERDLIKIQLEHSAKLASVGELAAGIAHEINNPLAIISEEAGLMKDLMNPEFGQNITFADLRPRLETINQAVFRCRDITRKLLSFVRKSEFKMSRCSLPAVMDEVVDDFYVREMALANIQIERNYAGDLPEILTDPNQLKQVFLNILNNAADAITGSGSITIAISRAAERLLVAITDTGCGMTAAQMGKIFMPFYTSKEVGRGTGLGLSVSYSIIKSLDGTIEVSSQPGAGSTFTISLPVR